MARQSSRNKSLPQKCKDEINESDNDSLLFEVVDNATGNDLPDDNVTAEESKEEEQDAAKNLVQVPKKILPLTATMSVVVHPVQGRIVK